MLQLLSKVMAYIVNKNRHKFWKPNWETRCGTCHSLVSH